MLTDVETGKSSIEGLFKRVGYDVFSPKKTGNETSNLGLPEGDSTEGTSSSSKGGLAGIYAAADKVRNVTVNIQNLVEKFTVNTQNGEGLSSDEIMLKIEEVLIKAVNDAELSLSGN